MAAASPQGMPPPNPPAPSRQPPSDRPDWATDLNAGAQGATCVKCREGASQRRRKRRSSATLPSPPKRAATELTSNTLHRPIALAPPRPMAAMHGRLVAGTPGSVAATPGPATSHGYAPPAGPSVAAPGRRGLVRRPYFFCQICGFARGVLQEHPLFKATRICIYCHNGNLDEEFAIEKKWCFLGHYEVPRQDYSSYLVNGTRYEELQSCRACLSNVSPPVET
ncbi:hypothetical protein M434DRAFT_36098 [Hypoxylon sp. CO27-5]|nr:hypothetical protein M434DRAFT_36098 [Hypoxylon sp. CO27-5]